MNQKRFFFILSLLCLFKTSESSPTLKVGIKGGNITLPCQYDGSEILGVDLNGSVNISVCQTEERSRVCKTGVCDVVIKDLRFSDAGKYILGVFTQSDLAELKLISTYQLCVDDEEMSVRIGEELKMDVLLPNADVVEHQSRRSTGWMKVWSRADGVQRERMTLRDRDLVINHVTVRDAGSYRVLDPEGEELITVKVKLEN